MLTAPEVGYRELGRSDDFTLVYDVLPCCQDVLGRSDIMGQGIKETILQC